MVLPNKSHIVRLFFCLFFVSLLSFSADVPVDLVTTTIVHAAVTVDDAGNSNYTEIVLAGQRIEMSALATADFNGDGYKEIVAAGKDGILYVVSTTDGTNWASVWTYQTNVDILAAGAPTATALGRIEAAPAIADLDNNGKQEIIIAVGGDVHNPELTNHVNGGVLVYTYNSEWNFTLLQSLSPDGSSGWPQPRIDQVGWPPPGYSDSDGYWDGISTTPAIGDIDGDGDLEIVVEGIDRRLHAWHHNGAIVAGWPIYSGNGDNLSRGGLASPAIGDLDGDGDMEIVFGTMNQTTTLWAVDGASNPIPGFPIEVEQFIHSSPSLGDIDGDGDLEIVAGSGWGKSGGRENIVSAWHHDGSPVAGWPQETQSVMQAPPALGDIDNDGDLEIVVGCGGLVDLECDKLYAWHGNGRLVAGFPATLPSPQSRGGFGLNALKYSPLLADFDGDGTVEIIATQCTSNSFLVVEPNGQVSDTSHVLNSVLMAPPMVDDVDNDGKLEILVGHAHHVTQQAVVGIFHEEGAKSSALPWPMFRQNAQRAGDYREVKPPIVTLSTNELNLMHQRGERESISETIVLANDGGGMYDWRVANSISGVSVANSSGTFPNQSEFTVTIDPSVLQSNGWNDVGTFSVIAESGGATVDGSPQSIRLRVFNGDVSTIYVPLFEQ